MISVQIILKPAKQAKPESQLLQKKPSVDHGQSILPDPQAIIESIAYFRELGFEVDSIERNSFLVIGIKERFAEHFGKTLDAILDVRMLPEALQKHVKDVICL